MTTLDLNGTWVLTKNVNMDKYLAEVGKLLASTKVGIVRT